jgi:hypothetical protein
VISSQKDATIRELTDRLYVGAEQFHRYLTSTSRGADPVPSFRNSSDGIFSAADTRADKHHVHPRDNCHRSFSDDDSSDTSSNDENEEPTRPQQLSVSDLLACKQLESKETDPGDRSVIGQDDSAYDNPSLQGSADITSWNSASRTVAVIHCQPITVSPADYCPSRVIPDAGMLHAEQCVSTYTLKSFQARCLKLQAAHLNHFDAKRAKRTFRCSA